MIVLRDYQEVAIAGVREQLAAVDKTLLVSPTGSGKTVMFSYIASRASQRGKTIGIFAHRAELLNQISDTLRRFNVPHGLIAAGRTFVPKLPVYVISAQTYASRVDRMPTFDLGIVDEAHHCTDGSTWGKCMAHSPAAKWIGVTATPERLDGRGLGESFDSMVLGPSVRSLIDQGALADYRLFAPPGVDLTGVHTVAGDFNRGELAAVVDRPSVTGDAVKHYSQHIRGAPSVVFCVSVAHAEHVAEEFRAAGYTAASVDGKLDMAERARRMGDFAAGRLNILTAADLISEGLDIPGIHGAILLRPTKSLGLYIQQVGRALRTAPGKDRAIIMDHAGNVGTHGLPDADREWSLEARARSKRGKLEGPGVRQCERCFCAFPAVQHKCPECGWVPAPSIREVEKRDGELAEVDTAAVRERAPEVVAQARARGLDELLKLGYSVGRANHIIQARKEKEGLQRQLLDLDSRLTQREVIGMKPKALRQAIERLIGEVA